MAAQAWKTEEAIANHALRTNTQLYALVSHLGVRRIEFWYKDHVLVPGNYRDIEQYDAVVPIDDEGNTLLRVPYFYVREVMNLEMAEFVEAQEDD